MCVRKASVQSKHRSQELMDFRFRENEDHEVVKLKFYLDNELFTKGSTRNILLYIHIM